MDLKGYDQWKTTPPENIKADKLYDQVADLSDEQLLQEVIDQQTHLSGDLRKELELIVFEYKADELGLI